MAEKFVDKMKFLVGIEKEEVEKEESNDDKLEKSSMDFEKYSSKNSLSGFGSKSNMKLVLIEPKSFKESPKIVDNLKNRQPIIINLEKLDGDTARKIFDFVSGAAYALDGNVQKVANAIFIIAPANVDISSDIENIAEKNSDPWK